MGDENRSDTEESGKPKRLFFPRWLIWLLLVLLYLGQTVVLGKLVMQKEQTLTKLREQNASLLKELTRKQRKVRELEERVGAEDGTSRRPSY